MDKRIRSVVIIGAGGIGSALALAITNKYPGLRCLLTYRTRKPDIVSEDIELFQFDPSQEGGYSAFIEKIGVYKVDELESDPGINWLINTCGLLHDNEQKLMPEKRLADFKPDHFYSVIDANVLPTVLLAKHLAPHFSKKSQAIFASISARVGSISDNRLGGWYSYRASKACLNMMIKNIAIEWAYKFPHICALALHPGTTDSQLSKPFQKNVPEGKLFSAEQTAAYLLEVLEQRTSDDSGNFYDWAGKPIPW